MDRRFFAWLIASAAPAWPVAVTAQSSNARTGIDIIATSKETFAAMPTVRPLPDGTLLLNDPRGRRVLLLDSTLSLVKIVSDSTKQSPIWYGPGVGMIAYKGDSTILVDQASLAMMVIDKAGHLARTTAVPRDALSLVSRQFGKPSTDSTGHLVYRSRPLVSMKEGSFIADSSALLRVNIASRAVDTVTFVRISTVRETMVTDSAGRQSPVTTVNPLPLVDDWVVLRDGTIAVIRGRTFDLDLYEPGASKAQTRRVPFEWRRLSDSEKSALLDSSRAQQERQIATRQAAGERFQRVQYVDVSELPDYFPAFATNTVLRDQRDTMWIKVLSTSLSNTITYLLVDRTGQVAGRVEVPKQHEIIEFGPDGSLYLISENPTPRRPSVLLRAKLRKLQGNPHSARH